MLSSLIFSVGNEEFIALSFTFIIISKVIEILVFFSISLMKWHKNSSFTLSQQCTFWFFPHSLLLFISLTNKNERENRFHFNKQSLHFFFIITKAFCLCYCFILPLLLLLLPNSHKAISFE